MTAGDEIGIHQARCEPYLLELQTLARDEVGRASIAAEVGRATGAIVAEVVAAGRAALAAAGSCQGDPGAGTFLQVRVNRLTAAANEAIAAAQDGDHATLGRILQRFETLTSAIWTVQRALCGPEAARPPSGRHARVPSAAR
jgi:hypothetical protein